MIRLGGPLSLIFFVLLCMTACRQKDYKKVRIGWTNKEANFIIIPTSLLDKEETDSLKSYLQVRLKNSQASMLGAFQNKDGLILFQPPIPLTRGLDYEIFFRNKLIGNVHIPLDSSAKAPDLLAVYPTSDTLPANLLKLYFQFSEPMRQGEALRHIKLLNNNNDTLPGIFLDLQPELWNKERTVLTVWLDPGRIKRGLLPNQKMGNPLQAGQLYTLLILDQWKDAKGLPLQHAFKRSFIVGPRDSSSPQIELWTMKLPERGTLQPLKIFLGESLDYFLLNETIRIFDEKGQIVEGNILISGNETSFSFRPVKRWLPGHYSMQVAPQLEDLAGNNLERLFDRDMLTPQVLHSRNTTERGFVISEK